jgi:hypothetical protein
MIYLIYAPSKSGTTSIFQALTENNMFPVIQTHGDFTHVGIHDSVSESTFSKQVKENFGAFVKSTNEFDGEVEWKNVFTTFALYFDYDKHTNLDFINFLRKYPLRIITPLRNPISRSISAMIHWLDLDGINALYMTKFGKAFDMNKIQMDDVQKLDHAPIQKLLKRLIKDSILTLDDVNDVYHETFCNDLWREYICVAYILRVHFGFMIHDLKTKNYEHIVNTHNNWELFTFKLEKLSIIINELYKYLHLSQNYKFPHARNKMARKRYIVDEDASKIAEYLQKHCSIAKHCFLEHVLEDTS